MPLKILYPLLFCLFVLLVFLVIKFGKKLSPEEKPAVAVAVAEPVAIPEIKPETPKYGKSFSVILLVLFFSGISFFAGIFCMYRIYDVPSQRILKCGASEFRGPWKLWILGPDESDESGPKVRMDPPRVVEVQSLEPNLVFSLSYVYKGKKQKAVYVWDKESGKGFWSQNNPPEKGSLHIEKLSDGFYSGWASMDSMNGKKFTMWLTGMTGKEVK